MAGGLKVQTARISRIAFNLAMHSVRYVRGVLIAGAGYFYRSHVKTFTTIMKQALEHRLALFLMLEWTRITDFVNERYSRYRGKRFGFYSPFAIGSQSNSYGDFRIRPHSRDLFICSPVYEYEDREYLGRLIAGLREQGRRVLFMDIGSSFGMYSVFVGRMFIEDEGVRIMSFEPAGESYNLLVSNLALNGLTEKATPYNCAVSDGSRATGLFHYDEHWANSRPVASRFEGCPGTYEVTFETVDSAILRASDYDVVVMKIDVEGAEIEVLRGAEELLSSGTPYYLLLEDFLASGLVEHMESMGASRIGKFTVENTWWSGGDIDRAGEMSQPGQLIA